MRNLQRDVLMLAVLALMGLGALTACNTLEGAGDDLENAGESVEDAVD
jgi:predicted small secreted protein